jgi:hypothetical protein
MLRRLLLPTTVIVFLLAACSEQLPEELPAEQIIANSAERMNGMEGFFFTIDRTGAPAFLDNDETISFRRAEGYYAAPDRSQAAVRVITPGLVTEVNVISIGETQWESNVMSAEWQQLPPNWGFNPAVLFDPNIVIQSILVSDLTDLQLLEPENLDDGPDAKLYLLSGILDGRRIYEMSYGLIGPEQLEARLWIMPETFELIRVEVTEANTGEEQPSVWQVDFAEFDRVVDIKPPVG